MSGNSIYIAAHDNVDIIGNKAVNIGGTRINLATLSNNQAQSGITMVATADVTLASGEGLDADEESYILSHLMDLVEPYRDTVSNSLSDIGDLSEF